MKLIFIYGLPATGKLTIAHELVSLTGFKLFHNHLVVDLLLSVFEFGSQPFIELREEIWLSVFEEACRSQLPGLIFTFAPERTVRSRFIGDAVDLVHKGGGEVDFVELTCPLVELRTRIDNPSRIQYRKLTDLAHFEQLYIEGCFDSPYMPERRLTLDTSLCTPARAALEIFRELALRPPDPLPGSAP